MGPRASSALLALVTAGGLGAAMAAAAPAGTTTTSAAPPAPTAAPTTTGGIGGTVPPGTGTEEPTTTGTTTTAAGPPRLASLRLSRVVTAQQGHAQLLVGARTSTPARLRVQITNAGTKKLVRTVTAADIHLAGRVYFLIEATTDQRFQLPAGEYRVAVRASDALGRLSNTLTGRVRLRLTEPRGRLDAYTIQLWPSIAAQLHVPSGGQLVAAVAPGGVAVAAGMRRGDVITSIGGISTATAGGMQRALRALPANRPITVQTRRGAQVFPFQIAFKPDWEPVPAFGPSLAVAVRRDPTVLAYAYAQAMTGGAAGDASAAERAMSAWRPSWRSSAAAQLLRGDLLYSANKVQQALGAYNRALAADPGLVAADVGRGLSLAALNRGDDAAQSFNAATSLDAVDSSSYAFRAYALLRDGDSRAAEALDAANRAIALDKGNEDGHVARGLALIALKRTADGVTALKRGLVLLNDPTRARQLITDSLEPNDP